MAGCDGPRQTLLAMSHGGLMMVEMEEPQMILQDLMLERMMEEGLTVPHMVEDGLETMELQLTLELMVEPDGERLMVDGGAPDGGGAPDATDGGPTAPWRGGAWKPKWRGSPGKGRGKGKGKGKGKPYRGNRGGRGRNEKKGTDKSGKGGNQKGNKRWWNYSDDAEESQHGTASPWEYV